MKAVVSNTPDGPSVTILAKDIVKISESITALRKSPLNEKAIVTLLADSTGASKKTIKEILAAIEDLKKDYLNLEALNNVGN